MSEQFKASNYVQILQEVIPGIGTDNSHKDFPFFKYPVLISDTKVKGFLNFSDLYKGHGTSEQEELRKRMGEITFDDPTNIQFTSGTTGYPKGATLSHHMILNNAQYIGEVLNYSESDRVNISVPLYHCFGMVLGNLACLNYGSTLIYPGEGFDPATSLEAIGKEKVTS